MDYLSLCLICKDENDYLPEWLDYHILMGVDRFYIYDNESRVSLRESLKEYIERGWVVVVDISGKAMQLYAYDHCLQTFGHLTFWLGFIDTDEFLVPKTTLDLKELLKGYEAYAGLAVSSLFFGSNDHQTRPSIGQIAAYTRRTHGTLKENELIKSIVQPGLTLMPNSPHDFTFKKNAWCVNEGLLRVDGQNFPNHTELIQLNHYFCRSKSEIDLKLRRGRGAMNSAWPLKRFEAVNQLATYEDTCILQNLKHLFQQADNAIDHPNVLSQVKSLPEKMAALTQKRFSKPLETSAPREALNFNSDLIKAEELKTKTREAIVSKDFEEAKRLTLLRLQLAPESVLLQVELASILSNLRDLVATWQVLGQAWQTSPNNYIILREMSLYFLKVNNFIMAENTSRLLLELAPHNLVTLGLLTFSLLGQERYEEALKIGIPVIELSAALGELPDGMSTSLVQKMAKYLLGKKDYLGAVRLWENGLKCQPDHVNSLLEISQVLILSGNKAGALQYLSQARLLAPNDEAVLNLTRQASAYTHHQNKQE
jgi:tetratricopeptide (TPR) repeat protein